MEEDIRIEPLQGAEPVQPGAPEQPVQETGTVPEYRNIRTRITDGYLKGIDRINSRGEKMGKKKMLNLIYILLALVVIANILVWTLM